MREHEQEQLELCREHSERRMDSLKQKDTVDKEDDHKNGNIPHGTIEP